MSRLRIAVIGGGHLGRIHTRLCHSHSDVELVGVVEPIAEKRNQLIAEFGVPVVEDLGEVLDRIDAAIVATTTDSHHEVACQLLRRGVHLFVEKPLTTTAAQADDMIALAQAKGLVLQAGHVERFNPAWRAVAHHLHRPRFIESMRASGYTFRSTDIGVVLDLMIHDLDLVLAMVRSELVELDAVGATIFGPHEDLAHAHLRFANGCVANLNVSRVSFQSQRSMQVLTDRAYVGIDFAANSARWIRPDKELVRGRLNIHDLSQDEKEHLKSNLFSDLLRLEEVPVEPSNAIQEEQRHFFSCVRQGKTPVVSGNHARDCLAVAEQILDCIRRKAPPARRDPTFFTSPFWHRPSPSEQRKAG